MKILIDEQLPTKLKFRFIELGYTTFTIRDMEWLGKKNGELLKLLTVQNFTVFITNDKSLYYQHKIDFTTFSILNINTKTNRYTDVLESLGSITHQLEIIKQHQANQNFNYYILQ